jgi:hypothetical protein
MPATAPSLLLHRASRQVASVPRFLADVADDQTVRVGASVDLPTLQDDSASERVDQYAEHAAYVLADPEANRNLWPVGKRGKSRDSSTYLNFNDAAKKPKAFTDAVLTSQAQHACTALISPWFMHGAGADDANLNATRAFAVAAHKHELAKDRPLLIGAGATESIIRDDAARDRFINELLDWPERPLYLRFQQTSPGSYAQYADEEVLLGLRQVVDDLKRNGRTILLPQGGLVGWLLMADGAISTGTGLTSSVQRFAPVMTKGGGGSQPLKWYFVPQLLGYIQRHEVKYLEDVDGFEPCECSYCDDLDFEHGAWDADLAGLHYLRCCANIVGDAGRSPKTVRKHVVRAADFWTEAQQAEVELDSRSLPRHLGVWRAVVEA